MSARVAMCGLLVVIVLASTTPARPTQQREAQRPGRQSANGLTLSGRVSFADGSPAASATLSLRAVGENTYTQRSTSPEDDGRFTFGDLQPGVYYVSATAPGYYQSELDSGTLVRPGDQVSITLQRGGVITGTVTGADGSPVVGMFVHADPIRPRATQRYNAFDMFNSSTTDDRGVYRIYGLAPDDYVVSVGGEGLGTGDSDFDDEVRVFYPSSRRQSATTLSVGPAQELTSIDIRYRPERGHRVSGSVSGPFAGENGFAGALVTLTRVVDGGVEQIAIVRSSRNSSFQLNGIADGEYQVTASSGFGFANPTTSESKRITVKGADLANIVLTLEPSGSIAGQLTIEPAGPEGKPGTCATQRDVAPVDVAVIARAITGVSALDGVALQPTEDVPSRRGAFNLKGLRTGSYALDISLGDDTLFVASIVIQKPKPESGPAPPPQDCASGVRVTPGEKIAGVSVQIGRGAGSIKGLVEPPTKGASLPLLSVFLVPLDAEFTNTVLRYRVTTANGKEFAFGNVAPGNYKIVVRERDQGIAGRTVVPWVTDAELRDRLRSEAKTLADSTVTIAPCQRVVDRIVRFLGTSTVRPKVRT